MVVLITVITDAVSLAGNRKSEQRDPAEPACAHVKAAAMPLGGPCLSSVTPLSICAIVAHRRRLCRRSVGLFNVSAASRHRYGSCSSSVHYPSPVLPHTAPSCRHGHDISPISIRSPYIRLLRLQDTSCHYRLHDVQSAYLLPRHLVALV